MNEREPLWSVELVIRHDERVAMDYAGTRVAGPENYMVVLPYEEGPSTFHVDVRAPTQESAQEHALELYARIRAEAELPPDTDPQVLTISSVAGLPWPWDRYIFAAADMLEQRRFALAVVAAQIHCEMFIRHALETVAEQQGTPLARLAPELLSSWSLTDRIGPRIFEALLEVSPTSAECWEEYKLHVYRRNAVVHQGAEVSYELANRSIDAAVAMVRFVEEALAAS